MKRHYYLQGSLTILIGLLMLSAATICNAEEITLTTYYPSPYGVYSEMRLYPKSSSTAPCVTGNPNSQPGVMFYDSDEDVLKICVKTGPAAYDWQRMGGGYWAASPFNTNNIYSTNFGNVGIGTNNPTGYGPGKSLHIFDPSNTNSGIRMQAGSTDVGIGTAASLNGMILGTVSNGPIQFLTNGSERMRIANNGDIGIGTTNPLAKLDIGGFANGRKLLIGQSPQGDAGFMVSDNNIMSGKFGGAFVAQPLNGNRFVLASYRGNPISFWTTTTDTGAGFQERLTILGSGINAGFVGIGTTNPQETLHVNGDIFVGGNFYKSGNLAAANSAIGMWGAQGGVVVGFNNGRSIGIGQTTTGYIGLGITQGVSPLATFYVGGELGIGTYVAGPPLVRMWAENPAGFAAADILIQRNGYINLRTQQVDRLVITPSGYVGMGAWPAEKLHVEGNIYFSGCARGPGGTYAGTCVSDERFKKNITSLSDSLEKIMALNPVRFEFNDPKYGIGPQEGLIAQEVEKIFPDWVSDGDDGYKRIKYSLGLQMRLIGAVKEQQKQIEELKTEVGALKTAVGDLKTKR